MAQRTYGTTDPGGVWHPVHRRECLTILLGTYAENGQIIDRRRTHCIRYSLLMPALADAYVIALTRSTIALEKNGCPLSLHLLEVLFVMYFKN